MKTYIRAFAKDGYHKDQVLMQDLKVGEPMGSMASGLIGPGIRVTLQDFPEIVYFEIVVKE